MVLDDREECKHGEIYDCKGPVIFFTWKALGRQGCSVMCEYHFNDMGPMFREVKMITQEEYRTYRVLES